MIKTTVSDVALFEQYFRCEQCGQEQRYTGATRKFRKTRRYCGDACRRKACRIRSDKYRHANGKS